MIIDVHAHIFDKIAGITNGYPATSEKYGRIQNGEEYIRIMPPSFERTDSRTEVLVEYMKEYGVDKAVIFSNGLYGYNNDFLYKSVLDYPEKFKALALVDITNGEKSAKLLDNYLEKGFMGLKIETPTCFQCTEEYKLDAECIKPVWEVVNKRSAIAMMHVSRPYDIDTLGALVEKYNKAKYVICHFGAEAVLGEKAPKDNWNKLIKILKNHNNVFMDTSSISYNLKEFYSFEATCNFIEDAVKEVGSDKILWGTDFPCMLHYATYRQLIDIIKTGCKNITVLDKQKILGENAHKLFFSK